MTATWYQVTCEIPPNLAEAVADFLAGLSGCGVCTENRTVDSFSTEEIPELGITAVTCYFALPCAIEQHLSTIRQFLTDLSPETPLGEPQVSLLGEEDWADSWKNHFKPMQIGKRLLITPSWETVADDERRAVIVLDPGMAFGTGGHETTRLCLECLEQVLEQTTAAPDTLKVLDLGTGSGILAIAGAKLGIKKIDAVDIDPQAVQVAAENCALNHVANQIDCSTQALEQLNGPYDIILANILAETLVVLAPGMLAHLAPDGRLILSGILAEREELVRAGFAPFPVRLEASHADGEWRCLQYRRSA